MDLVSHHLSVVGTYLRLDHQCSYHCKYCLLGDIQDGQVQRLRNNWPVKENELWLSHKVVYSA